jgi:drug/metabolite transporter (DMT)-like permease
MSCFFRPSVLSRVVCTVVSPYYDVMLITTDVRLAIQVAPSWLLANWTFNAALCQSCGTGTSVANCTLLSSSASVFTFFFSWLLLGDAFSPLKLLCAAVNLSGVALLVRYDGTVKGTPNMAVCETVFWVLCSLSGCARARYHSLARSHARALSFCHFLLTGAQYLLVGGDLCGETVEI